MEALRIKGTKSSPEINFDPETGILQMSGESYPENSFEFYAPVLRWLSDFLKQHRGTVVFIVHVSYLNTGSTKCMMDILDLFEESFHNGLNTAINWHCDAENDRAIETAEDFKEEVSLPFNIIQVVEP
jgi:hypothetical protein